MHQRCDPALAGAQVDNFRRQFDHLDNGGQGRPPGPNLGQATSLPRERVREFQHEAARYMQVGDDAQRLPYMPPYMLAGRLLMQVIGSGWKLHRCKAWSTQTMQRSC